MRQVQRCPTVLLGLVLAACASQSGVIEPEPVPEGERAAVCHRDALNYEPALTAVLYPRDQMMKRQEGWVVVGYDLDGSGSAQNLRILKSSPPGVFDTAVLRAFSGVKFKPETKRENCRGFVEFRIGAPRMR